MHIIFIVPDYSPHIGGVERHAGQVAVNLVRAGHQVTVFVEKRRAADPECEVDQGVRIIRFHKRNYWIFRKVSFKKQFIRHFALFRQADVVHFHDFSTFWLWGFAVQIGLRCLGKKIFITFHGWEGHVPPRKGTVIKRKICEILTDANICAGHFIEKWYGTRADLVTYGGCTMPPQPHPPPVRQNGLFIGRLEADTGIREYVLAWKTVNREFPDCRLMICGDGSLRGELQELTEKNQIRNVEFRGFVREPEKLLASAVFVFTSGFLGILEAFACRTPVIATYDNPLKKDYLTMLPNAESMLWIAADVPEIIAAVREILNTDVSDKITAACSFARQNSWRNVADGYLRLYQQHGCHV